MAAGFSPLVIGGHPVYRSHTRLSLLGTVHRQAGPECVE